MTAVAPVTPAADLEDRLAEARELRRAGELGRAADELRRTLDAATGIEAAPLRAALHRELAEVLLEQRQPLEAARQFDRALEAEPNQGVISYLAGLAYERAGDSSKAAERLDQAVRLGFRNAGVLLHLAAAHFAAGRHAAGLIRSREILHLNSLSANVLFRVGKLLFQQFFYSDALQAFEAALAQSPSSYETRFFTALTHYLLNRHQEAEHLLAALDEGRRTAESTTLLASAVAQQDRFAEAEALLEQAIELYPASPHPYLNLAFVLLEQDRFQEAEERFDQLRLRGGVSSPKALYAVRRNSCPEAAAELNESGVSRNPDTAAFYFELAESLGARLHYGTAVQLLRLARPYEGSSPRMRYALAYNCANLAPDAPAPITMLRGLLRLDPRDARAHSLLGRVLLRQGAHQEALAQLRSSVELDPENSTSRTELARGLLASDPEKNAEEAVQALSKAAALDATNVVARYELGKLLMRLGLFSEAGRLLEEAIAAEPEFYQAYYILGQLYTRQGRSEAAREQLRLFQEKREAAQARSTAGGGFANLE